MMKKILCFLVVIILGVNYGVFAKPVVAPKLSPNRDSTQAIHIDINKATIDDLLQLKGIGKKRAEAIVHYRTVKGPYKSIQGLLSVEGISQKTLTRIETNNPNRLIVKKFK